MMIANAPPPTQSYDDKGTELLYTRLQSLFRDDKDLDYTPMTHVTVSTGDSTSLHDAVAGAFLSLTRPFRR